MKTCWSLGLCLLICSALASSECLNYAPAEVTLAGVVTLHEGLKGFWSIALDQPICTIGRPDDPFAEAFNGERELQVIFEGAENPAFEQFRTLRTKRVLLTGTLMSRTTGYHRTNVLITVNRFKRVETDQGTIRVAPSTIRNVTLYSAAATVLPAPVDRLVKLAWNGDAKNPFPDSDRYIQHLFNGPMDIMWVKCADGYLVDGIPESTTRSSVFQMDPSDPKNPWWGVAVSASQRTNVTVRCAKPGY
jgi:hypothetical protein